MAKMQRRAYVDMFGPSVGDRVRLGDTNLIIEVEEDHAIYGEEVKFGGGKVLRDGMGQSQRTSDEAVDAVITNALILDHWGIVKADIGIKNGRIAGIGKAGNPDTQPGVDIVIGPGTEAIAGEGLIATAGGIDAHIHFICPQQVEDALYSGVTTMLGGGTGPAAGTCATTCTPGPWNMKRMLQAADGLPMNIGLLGKGNASRPEALREQVLAGAMGLKLHEDWGTTPAAIDNCLCVAEEYDVQVAIHTDTLNESGFVEDTLAAFKGRTIHAYHTEGAGGGIEREDGAEWFVRHKNIYYDTDSITEAQTESLLLCGSCRGLLKVLSRSTKNPDCLGVEIPLDACPACRQRGLELYEEAQAKGGFRYTQLINRVDRQYLRHGF